MAKILIPTPLRPYTDKQDAVDATGATVGELLADLTTQARRPEGAPLQRAGQAAQLRQHLRERRGHPLSAEGADAGDGRRHGQHHPVGRGRRADGGRESLRRTGLQPDATLPELTNDEIKRYSRHLIMPEVGVDGQRKLKAAKRALHRRRRPRLAGRDVSRRRRRRHARHRRLRRRRLQQPAAADPARHARRRPLEAGVGEGSAARASTRTSTIETLRDGAVVGERARAVRAATTSSSTAPTTSRRAIS